MIAALPHVVRGEVKGGERVCWACKRAQAFPAVRTAAVWSGEDAAAMARAVARPEGR
jgi:hypothetical protein